MGQTISTYWPTTNPVVSGNKLADDNRRLRAIIGEMRAHLETYIAEKDKQKAEFDAAMHDLFNNPQPIVYNNPVEQEYERLIPNDPKVRKAELLKFAEFITNNMDTILAADEVPEGNDVILAQLVNSAGFEYARHNLNKSSFDGGILM